MDATQIVTLSVAVGAMLTGGLAMRSDRTKGLAEATTILIEPLTNRITALEAEVEGWHHECARLRQILERHGITDLE